MASLGKMGAVASEMPSAKDYPDSSECFPGCGAETVNDLFRYNPPQQPR